ncbi:MAG: glycosyltransferase [Saprospiraceae bacterium]
MEGNTAEKRVLIITYYWPPSGGSGVQRWLKFSKYLPQFGWKPIIYTPENPDFGIQDQTLLSDISKEAEVIKRPIWEPYSIYRMVTGNKDKSANFGGSTAKGGSSLTGKLAAWIRGNFFIPDPRVFWKNPSIKYLSNYLKHNPVDVIVTTGPPHSMHLIGLGLKRKFPNISWVADMRDPWSTFDIHNSFLSASAKKKNAAFEKQVLDTADAVVMVSPSLKDEFQPFDHKKEWLISNGFDREDFKTIEPIKPEKFSIYHSGLFNFIRNPENLWIALEELCTENQNFAYDLDIQLIGTVDSQVMEAISKYPVLKSKVTERGWMQHDDIIKENNKAAVLMLVVNNSRNAKAQLTGKFFEYLALEKPIFAICPDDADVANAIKATNTGFACNFEEKDRIKSVVNTLYQDWKNNASFSGNKDKIEAYERKNLSQQLAKKMEDLIFSPPIAKH